MALLEELSATQLLKATTGRCPVCQESCPAEVHLAPGSPDRVVMYRECGKHGETVSLLSSDARFYWLSRGAQNGCCGGGTACRASDDQPAGTLGRNAGCGGEPFETLSTCVALIELVPSCNLACPVCYADSPEEHAAPQAIPSLENLQARVQAVIERKGRLDILQLSGGEPTLHPQFFEFLDWAQRHAEIDYVLLNTNGVRIAQDKDFSGELAGRWRKGKFQIYLQFDGVQAAGQKELRGMDLRPMREKVLEKCEEAGIPVTLAMTVTPRTLEGLWDSVRFALGYKAIRGLTFQPLFQSGRVAATGGRLNVADIILALIGQSGGVLDVEDFTPLPCGDPNCAVIGYLFKTPEGVRSIREFINFAEVQGFLQDRMRYDLNDLARCGCESEPLGEMLKQLEIDERHTFRLFIKPFMDAESWDEDRIDRCCTHVIRPDGKLDSFCRYYSRFPGAAQALR
jgi:uncharacterized radical SAM superfamily Fe-S cluster-containing enzyme